MGVRGGSRGTKQESTPDLWQPIALQNNLKYGEEQMLLPLQGETATLVSSRSPLACGTSLLSVAIFANSSDEQTRDNAMAYVESWSNVRATVEAE